MVLPVYLFSHVLMSSQAQANVSAGVLCDGCGCVERGGLDIEGIHNARRSNARGEEQRVVSIPSCCINHNISGRDSGAQEGVDVGQD
jgi:hypothetical protein